MEDLEEQIRIWDNTLISSKFYKLYERLDFQIKKNFKIENLATRPVDSSGLWCFILIPAVLLSYRLTCRTSPVYELLAFLSIGLLAYSVLFLLFLYMSCLILKGSYTSGCTVSVLFATVPVYCYLKYELINSLILATITVVSYSALLKKCLYKCPRTFTIGEAMVVSQGFSLILTTSVITLFAKHFVPGVKDDDEIKMIKIYVITVLSTVGILVTALYNLIDGHRNLTVLCALITLAVIGASSMLYVTLGPFFLTEFLFYVFMNKLRIKLFLFWLWLSGMAAVVVVYRSEIGVKVTSATRKSFHVLAALVFLTGVLFDKHMIMLASGILFGVIVFIEALRLSLIEPISTALQTAFNVYADEKDVGVFAVTPMYLYVGLACPLVLVPWGAGAELELLSGVLAIGVGDSAASYLGEKYGHYKWPGSKRTVEGTMANIGSQILTVYILNLFELLHCRWSLTRACVAAAAAGLAEARLEQVDNLILPLVTLLAFQLTAPLR